MPILLNKTKKKRKRHSTFPKQFSVHFHPFLNFRLILQLVDPRKNKKEIIIFLSSSFSRSRNSEIENTHLKLFHRGYYFAKLHYFEVARVSVARKIKIKAGIEMFVTHKEPVNKLPPRVQRFPLPSSHVNPPGKETNEISRETESTAGFSTGLNELFAAGSIPGAGKGRRGERRGGRRVLYRRKLSRIPRFERRPSSSVSFPVMMNRTRAKVSNVPSRITFSLFTPDLA